jgi:glutamate/tyrosine decarboxylase-like PLP-dependent enzyme
MLQDTGHYEPVEEIHKILDEYEKQTGVDIPIHVDVGGLRMLSLKTM